MKVNKLPIRVDRYYSDFGTLQDDLRLVIPSIKVKDVGFGLGMIYIGTLKSPANASLLRRLKEEAQEYNALLKF
jgi:hypothetical protein